MRPKYLDILAYHKVLKNKGRFKGGIHYFDQMDHQAVLSPLYNNTKLELETKISDFELKFKTRDLKQLWFNDFFPQFDNSFSLAPNNVLLSRGVRDSVYLFFQHLSYNRDVQFLLPNDLYPVYRQYAIEHQIPYQVYHSIQVKVEDIMGQIEYYSQNVDYKTKQILMIVEPCPIYNQSLSLTYLSRWLRSKPNRFLVFDTVYSGGMEFCNEMFNLLDTERVFILNSLSKSHCSPRLVGFNIVPSKYFSLFRENERAIPNEIIVRAHNLLSKTAYTTSMSLQKALYTKAWQAVIQDKRIVAPTTYYLYVDLDYWELLNSGIFAIPLTVFERKDLNGVIVSCLDIVKQIVRKKLMEI